MVRERGEAKVLLWYVRVGRQRSCYGTRERIGKGLVMVRERGEAKVLLWYVRVGRQRSCYGT